MDLGRFEISKGPSNRGRLDLGLFEKSNRDPPGEGGWTLDLSGSPTDPQTTLNFHQNHLHIA